MSSNGAMSNRSSLNTNRIQIQLYDGEPILGSGSPVYQGIKYKRLCQFDAQTWLESEPTFWQRFFIAIVVAGKLGEPKPGMASILFY
jgi:hypothetical protein